MRTRVRDGHHRPNRWLHHVLLLASTTALVACRSGAGASPPAAAPGPTPPPPVAGAVAATTTVPATSPRQQVEAAYLRSWDLYARAVEHLDSRGLEQAYAGRALQLIRDEVARRREVRSPARVEVDHDYTLRLQDADTATVVDGYLSHQVRIDPDTGEPIEADPRERRLDSYTLRRERGRWRVTDMVALA